MHLDYSFYSSWKQENLFERLTDQWIGKQEGVFQLLSCSWETLQAIHWKRLSSRKPGGQYHHKKCDKGEGLVKGYREASFFDFRDND